MMNQFLRHAIPALVVFLFMTAGCTLSQKKAEIRPETAVEDLPVTVAILPFENRKYSDARPIPVPETFS